MRRLTVALRGMLIAASCSLHASAQEQLFPAPEVGGRIEIEKIFDVGFWGAPLDLAASPDDSGRVFFTAAFGDVLYFNPDRLEDRVTHFLDLTNEQTGSDPNFPYYGTSIAFHPGFGDQQSPGYGKFYTISVEQAPTATPDFVAKPDSLRQHDVLYEWTATDPNATTFEGTSRELMRFEQSTVIHNVNDLAFAPDNTLYIGVGDDNLTFRPPNGRFSPSQDVSKVFGKILRIDPLGNNSANGQYGIPADNPFVGVEGAAEEVYAIGLRNPWRINVDPKDGVLYAADVGELNVEEVDVIVSGGNYGWAQKEGSRLADWISVPDLPDENGMTLGEREGLIEPLFEYDHTQGASISGGAIYRGDDVPWLYGKYVMTDYTSREIFVGDPATGELLKAEVADSGIPVIRNPVTVAAARDDLYILGHWGIQRINAAPGEPGDFNADGVLDATDINLLTVAVRAEETSNQFDITNDGLIDQSDRDQLIKVMMGTTLGDSNLDGRFDSTDFVVVFRAGIYEDDIDGNANWESGDWDGDGDFSTRDLVAAFREASYVREAVPVPEPSSCLLVVAGLIPLASWRMRRRRSPTC